MIIANETDLAPARVFPMGMVRRVLVFAPHADDEVFGCGGTLRLLAVAGAQISVIVVSDGALGGPNTDARLIETREAESCAAAELLGYPPPEFWRLPDRGVNYCETLVERMRSAIETANADLVFAPAISEVHPDHQAVAMAAAEALRRLGGERSMAFYEVGAPLPPTVLIDISAAEDVKREAMRCFRSQLGEQPYDERIGALNRYRAYPLGKEVQAAEAFIYASAVQLTSGFTPLFDSAPVRRQRLGFAVDGRDVPLVSIIIRSMDRPTLGEALDSISIQTYPNIEVVLVNAKGPEHRCMPDRWGRLPLRFVQYGESLQRARAANIGLDAACGEYRMFLDDDDWLEPDHVWNLVDALRQHPRFQAAYTGVRCVDETGESLPNTFAVPFDPIRLLAANFIPIHSILFSRVFLEHGCRMDESLDVYEDWDFFIQLSQFSDFVFVSGISAIYRIDRHGGSRVHVPGSGQDIARRAIFRKWQEALSGDRFVQVMAAVEQSFLKDDRVSDLCTGIEDRDERIAHLNQSLTERDTQLQQLQMSLIERESAIYELNRVVTENQRGIARLESQGVEQGRAMAAQAATIAELHNSTSWRVTRPLRAVGWQWRKVRGVATVARRLLARESLLTLVSKSMRVLWREGLSGVRARIRQQHLLATQAALASASIVLPAELGISLVPAGVARNRQGRYALVAPPTAYTYVEPQKTMDFETWLAGLHAPPRFALVVPVYNTPPALLDALVASVETQWYPHWQLILADDASPSEETRAALASLHHPKIEIVRLEKNQGISGATNAAIAAIPADCDYIVFLDHDDEITVDCLYELACSIEREQPDFIYSDEDKITADGDYGDPHFKPDWSPDTMMSTMFTCHVSCVRRTVLEAVGGLRSQFDGCQDWDFVLRVSEHTHRISHIPKVLYHWRVIPGSTAADIAAKSYILDASRAVREDALRRRGLAGRVEAVSQVPGYFRVIYEMRGNPLISIIIPTRDNERILRRCIDSIERQTRMPGCRYEIVIMDNGSVDPASVAYLEQIQTRPNIRVIRHDAPFNFSELNNLGAKAAQGELLLFLNDDTEALQMDWLERMGGYAQLDHIGAVGAKLLFPGGSEIQHAGVLNLANGPVHAFLHQPADTPGYFMRNLLEYNWLAVTGACLMIERCKFDAVGGFCDSLPVAYNDIDLCMRLVAAGYYNVVSPAVRLIHHESASRGSDAVAPDKIARLQREMAHLYERNPAFFQRDPFHNPNLHPNGINFEVPA